MKKGTNKKTARVFQADTEVCWMREIEKERERKRGREVSFDIRLPLGHVKDLGSFIVSAIISTVLYRGFTWIQLYFLKDQSAPIWGKNWRGTELKQGE